MTVLEDLTLLSRDALLRVITEQQRQLAELRVGVEALQAEVERLKRQGKRRGFALGAGQLQEEIRHHLRDRPLKDPDNQRLLNELGWHNDRGNLLRFLDDPRIEPTNNRAERALRLAVIARKVSQCSKNKRGAQAFAAFSSVVRTLVKISTGSLVDGLSHVFRSAKRPDVSTEFCH